MQVLVFDAAASIDDSVLKFLHARGYDVSVTFNPRDAVERLRQTEFDCILLDVTTAAKCLKLLEMRKLVRTSAVVFMTTEPIDVLVAEAEDEGSIEFQSLPVLIENLEHLPQPVMLVGPDLCPALLEAAKEKQLRVSSARTLQFVMNLMVDGWCQIVWLHTEIPGRAQDGKVAIVHQISAKSAAILASTLPDTAPGISCSTKPTTAVEYVTLLRRVADDRLAPCGRSEMRFTSSRDGR
jgi:CheY-like chemotaxis protein